MSILICGNLIGQNRKGIYKKRSCFCDNHSNSSGWFIGAAGYGSQLTFANNTVTDATTALGYGGMLGNKVNDNWAVYLGVFKGNSGKVDVSDDRITLYNQYDFTFLNIPIGAMYKFQSDKRLSPYVTFGGELDVLRASKGFNVVGGSLIENDVATSGAMNQFNIFAGGGTFILMGDHFGALAQVGIEANPFVNTSYSNYMIGLTGKLGLTYHFSGNH